MMQILKHKKTTKPVVFNKEILWLRLCSCFSNCTVLQGATLKAHNTCYISDVARSWGFAQKPLKHWHMARQAELLNVLSCPVPRESWGGTSTHSNVPYGFRAEQITTALPEFSWYRITWSIWYLDRWFHPVLWREMKKVSEKGTVITSQPQSGNLVSLGEQGETYPLLLRAVSALIYIREQTKAWV